MKDICFTCMPQGDRSVLISFANEISPAVNSQVLALHRAIEQTPLPGISGCVPAYRSLQVEYDPLLLTYGQVCAHICKLPVDAEDPAPERLVRIPVCYGGEFGPDLMDVAAYTGLSQEEVIRRHSANTYRVYMLGFQPGFPYLGGLDPTISAPRRKTPRQIIPAGSVGIAGQQTGIYSVSSPGGWNIIGRTPLALFEKPSYALLRPGDLLRFETVDPDTYALILEKGRWPL